MARAANTAPGDVRPSGVTVALIANPRSGTCDPERVAEELRAVGAEVSPFDIEEVEPAVALGADRVALAGGDGSIAPSAAAAGAAGVPLAIIPAGTANDFARRLGLPLELSAACRLAVHGRRLHALELGWMEPADGRRGRRPFVNVASAGLPAPAARKASAWKRPLGPLSYAAGALAAGATATTVPCRVACGDQTLFDGDAWQVTVAASGAFGAGSRIDEADPADGSLELVAVPAGPRPALVALAYRLRTGGLARHRRTAHARCRVAELHVPPGTDFNVDGEVVLGGPTRFSGQAAAFRLVTG